MESPVEDQKSSSQEATRKQIRGSSLLLAGRMISVGLNFATQVLIVRYLTKSDYGAWAYSFAIVTFIRPFATLGLKRSITRFIPIYHENNEYEKVIGTIALFLGTVFLIGLIVISMTYGASDLISQLINDETYPITLLLILIFLVPLEAIDGMIIGLFASFVSPRAIFFRRHIVAPLLKLSVVLLLIMLQSDIFFLAYGYLGASLIGIAIYAGVLMGLLRKQGIFSHSRARSVSVPAKEIFLFSIPLLTSDLVAVAMHSTDTLMLGYFHDTKVVAAYQVILPLAHINTIVMTTFGLLFTPVAARLFARADYAGINDLYCRTAVWLAILSFPVFALTFSMAKPLTLLLYGPRYEDSWLYLQFLALGYYIHVLLGFNGLTLKVLGKVRYVVVINVIAAIANVVLNLMLIPRYGALGATVATFGSMILHNVLKQTGLRLASGINVFERQYLVLYAIICSSGLALFLIQLSVTSSLYVLVPLMILLSVLVLRLCGQQLRVESTFPELLRVPLMRIILNAK